MDYMYVIGILVEAWPSGTIAMINELYGAESKSQVYGAVHTFIYENSEIEESR